MNTLDINSMISIITLNVNDLKKTEIVRGIKTMRQLYEVCPESIQPCNLKTRDIYSRRYKIQEILYVGQ